ncbi:hypothetical protein DD238_007651 [Peronospora effusa]|uniref:Uncharacterized protein n=1 Tax=Peronospora effusa TaxID=542832 RepID=A0A3M6V8Q4_9STRA|nr:hypothetical protein DD238_007651 [Peronospora effusa]
MQTLNIGRNCALCFLHANPGLDRLSKLKIDLRDDGQKFPCSEGNTCDSSTLIRMRLQTDGQAVAKDTAGSRLAKEAMDT